jgi:hypothetical protein
MATEEHNNDFKFNMNQLSRVQFQETGHSISKGQPYHGVTCSGTTLTVKAGRHGTPDVASWFKTQTKQKAIALTFTDTEPGVLNFAVAGKLTLTIGGVDFTCDDIVVGQGHTSSGHNNWWFGSPKMSGITWTDPTVAYLESLLRDAIKLAGQIVEESVAGIITEGAKIIKDCFTRHHVGSGVVAFVSADRKLTKSILFQMDNSSTTMTLSATT